MINTMCIQFVFITSFIDMSRFADATTISTFVLPSPRQKIKTPTTNQQSSRLPLIETPPLSNELFNNRIERFTKSNVLVQIERTAQNERRISGELTLNHNHGNVNNVPSGAIGVDILWDILTDYNNLSSHVPNLVESRIIRGYGDHDRRRSVTFDNYDVHKMYIREAQTKQGPRIFQKGAQKIWGFEFGADVIMDMQESIIDYTSSHPAVRRKCILDFKCVSSQFFSVFDGKWIVEERRSPTLSDTTITNVKYIVDVRPKGLVPVAALEWRIKEDVPTNMLAVVNAAANASLKVGTLSRPSSQPSMTDFAPPGIDWYRDETLSMYL